MTQLFVRFYLGVLVVLFLAWYIHGVVHRRQSEADRARVFTQAHGGGARLVARQLEAASPANREQVLRGLRRKFGYPIKVISLSEVSSSVRKQIINGDDVAYFSPPAERGTVVAALEGGAEVVRLGPFPRYNLREIEDSLRGWMRLAADDLNAAPGARQRITLEQLQRQFEIPLEIVRPDALPDWVQKRFTDGDNVVFHPLSEDQWCATTPLSMGNEYFRVGPFPSFEDIEHETATTTLALVLLPAALAIALLLRPVARQLRRVENAAEAIASGNLSARVDEKRMHSAKPLAQAFNHMARRTETLVRTQRELLQAVSHELRTPLSRMRFAIDLIETAKTDEERKQRLESLDAATEEIDGLVGELLSYVRMEKIEPQLDPEVISVESAVDDVISKFAALHPSIEIRGKDDVDGADIAVWADRHGFLRVLENLVGNAVRHAKGSVSIRTHESHGTTVIDVDDDGSGIPETDRERVFEPFVRLEKNASSGNGKGVGLGLALVKRIATQNSAAVEVLQSPLGGCRIRTKWPQRQRPS